MPTDPMIAAFTKRRAEILLDVSLNAAAIETWLKQYAETEPTVVALAEIEGFLLGRRETLGQLMVLDDEVITYLVKKRSGTN